MSDAHQWALAAGALGFGLAIMAAISDKMGSAYAAAALSDMSGVSARIALVLAVVGFFVK